MRIFLKSNGNEYGCRMIKKIDIMGIHLDNYTVREAIRQVEAYLSDDALNIIECVSMQMLLEAENDPVVREVLNSLDLSVIGEKEILQAAGVATMQRTKETEENDFSVEFFKRIERNKKSLFLLGETEAKIAAARETISQEYPKIEIVGEYAVENCVGNLEAVINDMNAMTPDIILSVLQTPMQEHFFMEHRDKMNANIWYGAGGFGVHKKRHGMRNFMNSMMHLGRLKNSMNRYDKDVVKTDLQNEDEAQ